nr:EOG090X0CGF [Cyclestheria hislopi]
MGNSYVKYLTDSGQKVNAATLSRFLQLCFVCRDKLIQNEVKKYCDLLKLHNQYLDASSSESLILGLCLTEDWREGLVILKDVEKTCSPRSLALNALAETSMLHGEMEVSLDMMWRILHSKKKIADFVFNTWISKSKDNEKVLKVFMEFVSKNEIYLNTDVVKKLKDLFETKKGSKFKGEFTTINKAKGICEQCKNKLKPSALTSKEYAELKSALMERVLQGPDVFVGSTPKELENFQKFVEETSPYDIVIDGLNVAYLINRNGSGKSKMTTLLTVVKYLANLKKKILVLGKNHMHRWSPDIVREIQKKASFFTTEDMSRDDPFLLYAALHSGRGTHFLSDDLMRDHMFRLKDHNLASLFRQWQHSSQLQLVQVHADGRVRIQLPAKYWTITQCNNGHWHIPYDDGSPRFTYQLPETILCLKPVE